MLEVGPGLPKESDRVPVGNGQAESAHLPEPTSALPVDPSNGQSFTSSGGPVFSATSIARLLLRGKLAGRIERKLSEQLRLKTPPPRRRLTRFERHIAQHIFRHKDRLSCFLLRQSLGAIKSVYGQQAVFTALVIGLDTRNFKLVAAGLNHLTSDELVAISGGWIDRLKQAEIEAKALDLNGVKLAALQQLKTNDLNRQETEYEGGAPTLFKPHAVHFVLKHNSAPLRFLLRHSMGVLKRCYGARAILTLLVIGIDSRDSKLIDASLRQLTSNDLHSLSEECLKQLSDLDTGGIGDDRALLKWLQGQLVLQLKSQPEAAAPLIEKIITLLYDLLKSVGVEEVTKTAEAFAAIVSRNPVLLQLLGHCEKWSGRLEDARSTLERALALPDADPMGYFELSEVLEFLGDDNGAIQAARKGQAHFSDQELFLKSPGRLTMPTGPLMRQGNLVAGWEQYQKRRDRFVLDAPPRRAIWQGESLKDETLLVLGEKGIGDEIRYASCYPDLLSQVRNVSVSADPRLVPLLERSFPDATFIPAMRDTVRNWKKMSVQRESFKLSRALSLDLYCLATQFDYLCMAGDLPLYLRQNHESFPRHRGYLVPDPETRTKWRNRLDSLGPEPKVGITWRSAVMNYKRSQHYFTIEQMLPVLRARGVHFVNLQYDSCEEELSWLEQTHGIPVHRWEEVNLMGDLEGYAALLNELDLVIAPHTMVKEMAGAVGTPTLFMAPTGQAWVRWRANPTTFQDIWHPSVAHVPSAHAGDKEYVVSQTAERLEAFLAKQDRTEWRPQNAGFHAAPENKEKEPDAASVPEPVEKSYVNEYGEIYRPAGVTDTPNKKESLAEFEKREAEFRRVASLLFRDAPQPREPKGVFLLSGHRSYKQAALTVLGAHGLAKRGWAIVPLDQPTFEPGHSTNPSIAHFREILLPAGDSRAFYHRDRLNGLRFDWEVDWQHRICAAGGINFYPIIANRLGKEFRRYSVDVQDPAVLSRLSILLGSCDAALEICWEAEELLAPLGIPVRFSGFEPNYPTTGVFKVYCHERGRHHGIEFVEMRQAYEKYFRSGRSGFVRAIDVQNVTRHDLYSAGALRGDLFEEWLKRNGKDPSTIEKAKEWANQDRSGHGKPTVEGEVTLERIRQHKARGGKVACLYGCIPFDFGHPWPDKGPAHEDLQDWYNHTVETLNDTDVLLLVKPHPSEADFQQFGRPNEFFVEMLKGPAAKNVYLLGHHWLNNRDLTPHLDFGIVWRGSIATELSLMGVPVVVCAPYSMVDHVLDLPMLKDRADYEDMVRHSDKRIHISEQLTLRAGMVFEFYRTQTLIEYPFGWISSKRKDMGPPVLSEVAIKQYLQNGHPSVDKICARIE